MWKKFKDEIARRTQGTTAHVNAIAAIDDLVERGVKIVRELNPIMRNIFDDNHGKLAAWLSASHIERAPRRSTAKTPPAPPPTPSA